MILNDVEEYKSYDIEAKNYEKRLRVWKDLTLAIIQDYKVLLQEMEHVPKMKASSHNTKILPILRVKSRIYRDYCKLMSGHHNLYVSFRRIYFLFLDEIELIEKKMKEIIMEDNINESNRKDNNS